MSKPRKDKNLNQHGGFKLVLRQTWPGVGVLPLLSPLLQVGSGNGKGGRKRNKQVMLSDLRRNKNIDVTHIDVTLTQRRRSYSDGSFIFSLI